MKANAGFSLVELLIAVTIAVSSIAITQTIYSGYVAFEFKSKRKLKMLSIVPVVKDKIELELINSKKAGEVNISEYRCPWDIKELEQYQPLEFDPDRGGQIARPFEYYLYTIEFYCVNSQERNSQTYNFKSLQWLNKS